MVSFRFHTFMDEEVELSDFVGGNISNDRLLVPVPITPNGEGEWNVFPPLNAESWIEPSNASTGCCAVATLKSGGQAD